MMDWIRQVEFTLVHEDVEVIVLGAHSARELVANFENWLAPPANLDEPAKPTEFMGVPIVPTRSLNKLLVEVHGRDPYTGLAKIVRLR